jgi:membrane-associated phospholipid phosphatase
VAFSVASALAHEYDEVPYLAPAAYTLATLVALERINLNAHFASDVFFAGAIGFFTGKFLAERHPALPGGGEIVPQSVAGSTGLALSWRF